MPWDDGDQVGKKRKDHQAAQQWDVRMQIVNVHGVIQNADHHFEDVFQQVGLEHF